MMKKIESIDIVIVWSLIIFLFMLSMTTMYSQTPRIALESGQEISVTANYISYRHWDSQKEEYVNDEEYLESTKLVFQDDAFYIQWSGDSDITKQWWVYDERRESSCRNCFLLEPKGEDYSNSVCLDYCDDLISIFYDYVVYSDGSGRWVKVILLTRLDVSFRDED